MKTITIEELEQLTPGSVTIVDVRPADTYQRGTFEGAINVPMKEFVDRYEEIPKDKPVWVLCHTGERSLDYVNCSVPMDMMREILPEVTAHICVAAGALHERRGRKKRKDQGDRAKSDQKIPEIHLEKFYACDPEI